MALQTSFTIKQVNVDQALKKAEKKAEQTAKRIDKTLNQSGQKSSTKETASTIRQLSKGASTFGGGLGGVGKIAGNLLSKFALIGTGISLLISSVKNLWDVFTVSEEQFLKKQQVKLQTLQNKYSQDKQKQSNDNGYLQRLEQLSKVENISNKMKIEAINLVELLTKRYGDLGIQIDNVTGQITGLDKAQSKMLYLQAKQTQANIEQQLRISENIYRTKLTKGILKMSEKNWDITGIIPIQTTAYDLSGRVTKSVAEALKIIADAPLQKQKKILEQLINLSTTGIEIDNFNSALQQINKQIKLQQRLNQLKKNGFQSEKEYAEFLKRQATKDKIVKNNEQMVKQGRKQTQLDEQMLKMQENADYSKLTKTYQQIEFLQKKLVEEKEKQQNLDKAIADIENTRYDDQYGRMKDKARILDMEERIAKLKQLQKQGVIIRPQKEQLAMLQKQLKILQERVYPHDEDRSNDLVALNKLETERKEVLKQQLKLKLQIEKLQETSNKFYSDRIQNYDAELAVQKLILQGKYEEAERQKLINKLKADGLKIDEKRVNADEAKRKELADVNIQQQLKNDAQSLLDKYAPKTKEYRTQRRIEQLEKANGKPLTDKQKQTVKNLVELEIKFDKLQDRKSYLDTDIQTNQLTRRGGFASGAVFTDKDTVNKEIKNINIKQANLLKQIKDLIDGAGKI